MEIPKNVQIFGTYDQADEQLGNYHAINAKAYEQLMKLQSDYETAHPKDYKMVPVEGGSFVKAVEYPQEIGSKLEFICLMPLTAIDDSQQKIYRFEFDDGSGPCTIEESYQSLQSMADTIKEWLKNRSAQTYGAKITPFFYTVAGTYNAGEWRMEPEELKEFLQGMLMDGHFESQEEMQRAQDELNKSDFEAISKAIKEMHESGLTPEEIEEFKRAFFTG